MATLILSVGVILLAVAGLALGVIAGRTPIRGSCGGAGACGGACATCPRRDAKPGGQP